MKDQVDALRESMIMLVRGFGLLAGRKTFCAECSYAECHAIIEVAKDTSISLNELAGRLNVAKSAMSRTVDDLVKTGHLYRDQDPDDRRYIRIELTAKGKALHREIEINSRRQFADIFDRIPKDKRMTVIEGIEIIGAAIRDSLSGHGTTDEGGGEGTR